MVDARIVVVEDEAIVAMDIAAKLRRFGYEVAAVVDSGAAAIGSVAAAAPDLVLMDIRLSGAMDGIEAAAEIRERFDIPVVFLTAHADEATVGRSSSAAPYGYVLKPFDEGSCAAPSSSPCSAIAPNRRSATAPATCCGRAKSGCAS